MSLRQPIREKNQQVRKLKLNFAASLANFAKINKLVIIYGLDHAWLKEMFATDPTKRTLWFQLQWFCQPPIEIETEVIELAKKTKSNLYEDHFYAVDSIVNYGGIGGYLDLLDSIAFLLEGENYLVKKVLLEYDTFEFPREIGFEPYYPKPRSIKNFRDFDSAKFSTFDANDQSLFVLPFKGVSDNNVNNT